MTALEQLPGNEQQCAENLLPFEVLYERYFTRIYRYIRTHLHNDDDAADLVQQVFFQIWIQLNAYRTERGSFATWIFSIAHHRLVDYYRAHRSAVSWESIYEVTTTEQNPEEIVISGETLARVKDLLDALSDAERELLALRFAARLSLAEIASIIGKSVEATRKQLTRLIQRLHRQYRQQDQEALLPVLLETALPIFVAALLQVYASPPPIARLALLRSAVLRQGVRQKVTLPI
jgi:RNA polymerase sigma factor (sigma-70 family)